jgi:hypothetical protein
LFSQPFLIIHIFLVQKVLFVEVLHVAVICCFSFTTLQWPQKCHTYFMIHPTGNLCGIFASYPCSSWRNLCIKSLPYFHVISGDLFIGFFKLMIRELQPPHAGSSLADFSTRKMEVIRSSETSAHTRSTPCHIPEDGIIHYHYDVYHNFHQFFAVASKITTNPQREQSYRRYENVSTSCTILSGLATKLL